MRSSRLGPAVAVLAVLLLLPACTSLPDEGPVSAATTVEPSTTTAPFDFNPPGPRAGATPEQVVGGFLNALQATPATTEVAEQFLTQRAVDGWRPGRRTVVYGSERVVSVEGDPTAAGPDAQVTVTLELTGTDVLDGTGRWLAGQSRNDATRLTLRLERVRGEWRLDNPPAGVVIPQSHFASRYRQFSLYFFDPTGTTLVPEPVYLPWGVQAPTQLVSGLLAGPPTSAAGARGSDGPSVTRTYLPPGTRVGVGVPVVDGVADVPLSSEILEPDVEQRDLALAQLAWTVRQVTDVQRLRVTVDGTPLELPDGAQDGSVSGWDAYSPVVNAASTDVFGLRDGEIRQVLEEEEITAVGLDALDDSFGRARSLGVDMSGQQFALVSEDGSQVAVLARAEDAGSVPVLATSDPLRPMWDHVGVLWVVDRSSDGAAVLVRRKGSLRELPAPGLAGADVTAVALSRDGSRLAAVRRAPGGPEVVVARVLRTARGTPVGLTRAQPVSTGVSLTRPVSLGWRDPTSVAVLTRPARGVGRVVLLPADGATSLPAPRTRVEDFPGEVRTILASPGGPTALLLWDREGGLHALDVQGSWELDAIEPGLRAPTFVG